MLMHRKKLNYFQPKHAKGKNSLETCIDVINNSNRIGIENEQRKHGSFLIKHIVMNELMTCDNALFEHVIETLMPMSALHV